MIAQKSAPTLLKYAEANPYPANVATHINQVADIPVTKVEDWCNLVEHTPHLQSRILASVLYRFGQVDYAKSVEVLQGLSRDEKEDYDQSNLYRSQPLHCPVTRIGTFLIYFRCNPRPGRLV